MNNVHPAIIKQTLIAKRISLLAERSKLDADIAHIDAFLSTDGSAKKPSKVFTDPKVSNDTEVPISRKITDFASANILPGVNMTTEKIYHLMVINGAKFPQGISPQSRITRVISGTGLYKGHKSKGWSLKSENPAGAGFSGATESDGSNL